jgi:hypothetical protein
VLAKPESADTTNAENEIAAIDSRPRIKDCAHRL